MGDINLLGMIRKLKSSLSGFVGKNDKATKSAFGVVKIGDNISVSRGTISVPVATEETYGVVKAGGSGVTIEEIWNGNLSDNIIDITSALVHPLSEYKAIFFNVTPSGNSCAGTGMIFVSDMPTATNNFSTVYWGIQNTSHIDVRLGEGTVSIKAGATTSGVHMYGIK